jgi:hypothetical protein
MSIHSSMPQEIVALSAIPNNKTLVRAKEYNSMMSLTALF